MDLYFGKRLREMRKVRKLSQSKLGKMVGVHYNRIGKYEMGTAYPSVPVLIKLSEVLEISMDDLIRGLAHDRVDTAETDSGAPASSASSAAACSTTGTRTAG